MKFLKALFVTFLLFLFLGIAFFIQAFLIAYFKLNPGNGMFILLFIINAVGSYILTFKLVNYES